MRAAGLLLTFASIDVGLVAVAGTSPSGGGDLAALRIPMLAILAITAIGIVALAVLSFAVKGLARFRHDATRAAGGLVVGAAYAAAILGSLGWAALWFSPEFALVALAGLVCGAVLFWQLWAESVLERVGGGDPSDVPDDVA